MKISESTTIKKVCYNRLTGN